MARTSGKESDFSKLILLVLLFLLAVAAAYTPLSYSANVSTEVDREIMFSAGGSSLSKEYVNQKFVLQMGIDSTLSGGRGGVSGSTVVERANLYRATGDCGKAEHQYWGVLSRGFPTSVRDAIRISDDQTLPKVDCVARAFAGLGRVSFLLNKPAQAECTYKRAIAMYKERSEHLLLAATENNLAVLYHSQGKKVEAQQLLKAALVDCHNSLPKDPNMAAQIQLNCNHSSEAQTTKNSNL